MAAVVSAAASISGYFAAVRRLGLDRRVVVLAGLAAARVAMEEAHSCRLDDVAHGYDDLEALADEIEANPGGLAYPLREDEDPEPLASVGKETERLAAVMIRYSNRPGKSYSATRRATGWLSMLDGKSGLTELERRELAAFWLYRAVSELAKAAWYPAYHPDAIYNMVEFSAKMSSLVLFACGERDMATPKVPVAEYRIVQVVHSTIRSLSWKR